MTRKRRRGPAAAFALALLLLATACGSPTEDAQGRLGDWTRGTRHIAALNSSEPIFFTRASGGERLVLNCGALSRSQPVAFSVESAPGRPLGPAPGYERANDRSVDYRGEAGGGTMRGNVSANGLSFYGDGPGHLGQALPRLADSARFTFEFSDGHGRPQSLAFATEGADDAIDRLAELCPETLSYKLTPP